MVMSLQHSNLQKVKRQNSRDTRRTSLWKAGTENARMNVNQDYTSDFKTITHDKVGLL